MLSSVLAIIVSLVALSIDQLTKLWVMSEFSLGESRDFIKGIFNLVYIHNQGAAWGSFSGKRWFLIGITLTVMTACVVLIIKNFRKSKLFVWSLCLVVSGGIGNLIDRIFRDGNVIDFLQFDFYKSFPIFNFADCCIVVGAGLLILNFLLESITEYKEKKALKDKYGEN